MKVLYVNMGDEHVAGSERSMLDLIAAGGDRIAAHVLCNAPALARATERLGHPATLAELVELSPYATPAWPAGAFWRGVRALVRCARAFGPDLIHANNVWPTQLAVAARLWVHRPVVGYVRATTYRSGQELSLMRLADHVIAVSETVAGPFRAMRLRRGGVSVVFDPIDVPPPPPHTASEGPVRLGIAGRLSEEKAVHRAVELVGWLRRGGLEAELTIFGEGPTRDLLEETTDREHLRGHVTFAGFCTDLPARLAGLDALLLCSLREALPRVIVEAGLAGVPAISVPVGGIAEVVDTGATGLLVDDFESETSRRAVLDLLGRPGELAEMGRRMQTFCRRHFLPAHSCEATLAVYRRVLAGRGRQDG